MAILRARGIVKRFGGRQVLRGVDLDVETGEIVGVVGPNGAGKTTLIRILLGLLRRDEGVVELMGRDPFRDPRAREGVGVIFERPNMPGGLPVREVLGYAADIMGVPRDRVKWAIEAAGLSGHEHKRFQELSAGLKQRAALAHALLGEPRLIIADEPTANLDPVERVRILDRIAELSRNEGVSFLVTGHVLHEIVRIADRIVILSSGRVIASGSIEEVASVVGRVARIRTPRTNELAEALRSSGFDARVVGLSVVVRLEDGSQARLFKALAEASEGIPIYSIDFVEAGIEEVLGGGGDAA